MKQHITERQLNELSKGGKRKLWEFSHKSDYFNEVDSSIDEPYLVELPLLSIGQMIEFLDDHETIWGLQKKDVLVKPFWRVGVGEKLIEKDKLVDCLWEAVKETLEK